MEEARNLAFKCIDEGRAASIATANAEMVMRAQTDRRTGHILQHADLVVPDGAGVLWAAEQQGKKFKERVTGVDLACSLLQEAAARQTLSTSLEALPALLNRLQSICRSSSGRSMSSGLIRVFSQMMKKKDYRRYRQQGHSNPFSRPRRAKARKMDTRAFV